MYKHAQWASMHMYFTTFPFFFSLSAFKNQHNRNKKKPQLPYYWITKQCVWETPLWSFKRVKRKMSCTYSTAAGILVKGDTNPELLERWLCSRQEVGEWRESLGSWLTGRRGGRGGVEDERQKRQQELSRGAVVLLEQTSYPKLPYFKQVYKKFKEIQPSARWKVALGT